MERPFEENRLVILGSMLVSMHQKDQEMRKKHLEEHVPWDDALDQKNSEELKKIIAEIGWPGKSKVGSNASLAAWVIVQHADHDVAFQKNCLELMRQEPDVQKSDIAFLTDRIMIKEQAYQLYGTQLRKVNGKYESWPIINPEQIIHRRIEMEIPDDLEEYVNYFNKRHM